MVRLTDRQTHGAARHPAYALSRGAEISYPSAYRLSRPGGRFGRLHSTTAVNFLMHPVFLERGGTPAIPIG